MGTLIYRLYNIRLKPLIRFLFQILYIYKYHIQIVYLPSLPLLYNAIAEHRLMPGSALISDTPISIEHMLLKLVKQDGTGTKVKINFTFEFCIRIAHV